MKYNFSRGKKWNQFKLDTSRRFYFVFYLYILFQLLYNLPFQFYELIDF